MRTIRKKMNFGMLAPPRDRRQPMQTLQSTDMDKYNAQSVVIRFNFLRPTRFQDLEQQCGLQSRRRGSAVAGRPPDNVRMMGRPHVLPESTRKPKPLNCLGCGVFKL